MRRLSRCAATVGCRASPSLRSSSSARRYGSRAISTALVGLRLSHTPSQSLSASRHLTLAQSSLPRSSPASLCLVPSRAFASSSSSSPGILVWADHDGKTLHSSTLSVITAAKQISSSAPITVLISGKAIADVAKQAAALPVAAVLTVDDPVYDHQLPEPTAALIVDCLKSSAYSHFLLATTSNGRNLLGRVGVGVDSQPVTDVIEVKGPDTFVRPIYAGNALCTVQLMEKVKLLSIRPTNFEKIAPAASSSVSPSAYSPTSSLSSPASALSSWVKDDVTTSPRPDLSTARVVVSGGRGLKTGDNFALLEKLADLLGGAVGASRAAVDAGMVPNEYQVGQTGKVVAPDLYIAVGISGAIQHLAGMKDSKVIVAINKDGEAPIFQVADYGLVDDLFKALPALTQALEKK